MVTRKRMLLGCFTLMIGVPLAWVAMVVRLNDDPYERRRMAAIDELLKGRQDPPLLAPLAPTPAEPFLPLDAVEWVIDLEPPLDQQRFDPSLFNSAFDATWRGATGALAYRFDESRGDWTTADAPPKTPPITKLAVGVPMLGPEGQPKDEAWFREALRLAEAAATRLGPRAVTPRVSPEAAARRAQQLTKIYRALQARTEIMLVAPPQEPFDGKRLWKVMLDLGLTYNYGNQFEWLEDPHYGGELFSVAAPAEHPSTLAPEDAVDGTLRVEALVFSFHPATSPDADAVLAAMLQAAATVEQRLGGRLVDVAGQPMSVDSLRDRVARTKETLVAAGLHPGTREASALFTNLAP